MILAAKKLAVSVGLHKVCLSLDLALPQGGRLAILGRNGAGKSTLLSTLAGLRGADAGTLHLDGKTYAELGPREAAKRRGWLGQNSGDPFASTVLETVLIGRHPHLSRWAWETSTDVEIARRALADVGLAGFEEREIHTLSGGEYQRVRIATLLAQRPKLYLLDEPLAHLDLNHQLTILALFERLAREQGAAVVMVLHDPNLALRFCDQALLLYGDARHRIGPATEILQAEILSDLYGCRLRRVENFFVPE